MNAHQYRLLEKINTDGGWVLEWSFEQKCFHVETLLETFHGNFNSFLKNRKTEYIPIGFFRTNKEAHDYAEELIKQGGDAGLAIAKKSESIWVCDATRPF